jgi:hypothetical protein
VCHFSPGFLVLLPQPTMTGTWHPRRLSFTSLDDLRVVCTPLNRDWFKSRDPAPLSNSELRIEKEDRLWVRDVKWMLRIGCVIPQHSVLNSTHCFSLCTRLARSGGAWCVEYEVEKALGKSWLGGRSFTPSAASRFFPFSDATNDTTFTPVWCKSSLVLNTQTTSSISP